MSLTDAGSNPAHQRARHWTICLILQAYEFAEAIQSGDYAHAEEEMADAAAVAMDCIRLMYGHDAFFVLNKRMLKNVSKEVGKRETEYYAVKLARLKEKLGVLE